MTASPAAQPGGREPAPSPLDSVQAFVNTTDIESGSDELSDPASASACLARIGLPSRRLGQKDVGVAVRFREALRDAVGSGRLDSDEWRALGDSIDGLRLTVRVEHGVPRLQGSTPIASVLAPLVDAIRTTIDDGRLTRLKVCARDDCRWLFYDHSRNNASTWCASSVCGNREKARRYRERHAADRHGRG